MSVTTIQRPGADCATKVLSDAPADHDAFGSHRTIAHAILSTVSSEERGKAIGLEGPWGVGKSTIVKFVKDEIRLAGDDVFLWKFDAWAHEGDPLRRTFLESLITEMKAETIWLRGYDADGELERLRGTHKKERSRTSHRLSAMGRLLGIGLLLVPVGVLLLDRALDDGLSIAWLAPPNWRAVLALGLMGAPLILPLVYWLVRQLGYEFGLMVNWIEQKPIRGFATAAPYLRGSIKFEAPGPIWRVFGTLEGDRDIDAFTDSFTEGEPTSLEFAKKFGRILDYALSRHLARKLVVVLDNLDRLPRSQAKEMWATLQPFMQPESTDDGPRDRLFTLVTYDRAAIRTLGVDPKGDSEENPAGVDPDQLSLPARKLQLQTENRSSFVEKTIRVEYSVPKPLLSDWRSTLFSFLEEALPGHKGDNALRSVVDLSSIFFEATRDTLTPRGMKSFVNSIGAHHRIWCGTVPIVDIAYHVLRLREGKGPEVEIDEEVSPLVSGDIEDNLYALAYVVPPNKGRQLRVQAELRQALVDGDSEALGAIAAATEGHWEVIEHIVATDGQTWIRSQPAVAARAAYALTAIRAPTAKQVASRLVQNIGGESRFSVLDKTTDAAVAAMRALVGEDKYREISTGYLRQRIAATISNEVDVGEQLTVIAEGPLGVLASYPITDPEQAHAVASALAEFAPPEHPAWKMLSIKCGPLELWETSARHEHVALPYLVRMLVRDDNASAAGAIAGRMEASQVTADPGHMKLRLAALLECAGENVTAADAANRILASGGPQDDAEAHLDTDPGIGAMILLLYVVTGAKADMAWIQGADKQTSVKVGRALYAHAAALGRVRSTSEYVLRTANISGEVVAGYLLDTPVAIDSIPIPAVKSAASRLNGFSLLGPLVARAEDSWRDEAVKLVCAGPFAAAALPFYRYLLAATRDIALAQWLQDHLESASATNWGLIVDRYPRTITAISSILGELGHALEGSVGKGLESVLKERICQPIREEQRPSHLARLRLFSEFLNDEATLHLADDVYDVACAGWATLHAWFFKDCGHLLALAPSMVSRAKTVDDICIPIAKRKTSPTAGVRWMADLFERSPPSISTKGRGRRKKLISALKAGEEKVSKNSTQRTELVRARQVVESTMVSSNSPLVTPGRPVHTGN